MQQAHCMPSQSKPQSSRTSRAPRAALGLHKLAQGQCHPAVAAARPAAVQLQLHSIQGIHTQLHCASIQPASAPAAPAPVQPAAAAAAAAAVDLPACQPQDILKATKADGSDIYLEVLNPSTTSSSSSSSGSSSSSSSSSSTSQQYLAVALEGVLHHLQPGQPGNPNSSSSSTPWLLQPQGWVLQPAQDLVKALPGWSTAVQQQQARQQLPQRPLLLQSVSKVYSAAALQAAVQQNPAPWRDGTGPNDPPIKGLQYQTLCAGEIEALLAGQRGVVMVQLWVGWDASAPQPVHNCLVLHALQRALSRKDISIFMSNAPGAGGLGLTAILTAQVEPHRSWGRHLASFGAQAALVADSPYYKLLIGRILGYSEPNIRHHIQVTTGRPITPDVCAAVDKDLRNLSKVKPKLPWKAVPAAVPAAAAAEGGSGSSSRQQQQPRQQQQQLSRSARKKASK